MKHLSSLWCLPRPTTEGIYCLIETSFGSESHHCTCKPVFSYKNSLKVLSSQTLVVFNPTLSLKLFRDALKDLEDDDASLVCTGRRNELGVTQITQSSFSRVLKKTNYHAYKPKRKHDLKAADYNRSELSNIYLFKIIPNFGYL